MADNNILAYGEITLLDLLDTATYIYYAEDETGKGAKSAPFPEAKFIGIYSGAPVTDDGKQPETPPENIKNQIIWSKYVGEQGNGIERIDISYQIAPSENELKEELWEAIAPDTSARQGEFLWTRTIIFYTDGTELPSLSSTYIPIDGDTYFIETNYGEVNRFKEGSEYTCTPSLLTYSIKDKKGNLKDIKNTELTISPTINGINDIFEYLSNFTFNILEVEENSEVNVITEDENSTQRSINLFYIFSSNISATPKSSVNVVVPFEDFQNYLRKNDLSFNIKYVENNSVLGFKSVLLKNGTTEDMLDFRVTATQIMAAVSKTGLLFNAEGLSVKGGGFKITDDENNPLLEFNPDTNKLELTGELKAATGSFEGIIRAIEGQIGGWNINGTSLYTDVERPDYYTQYTQEDGVVSYVKSTDMFPKEGVTYYTKTGDNYTEVTDFKKASVVLDSTGEIYANKITLGIGAKVEDYIALGDAKIYNPELHNGAIIGAGDILINQDGTAQFGGIQIGQENGDYYLRSQTDENGYSSWIINADGSARFDEIEVNNAKISNTVLSLDSVQAVGSSMIFRPSSLISEYDGTYFTLETELHLQQGDKVYYITGNKPNIGTIADVNSEGLKIKYSLENTADLIANQTIIIFLARVDDNYIFSINSAGFSDNDEVTSNFVGKRSLTLTKYEDGAYEKVLVLGDLDSLNKSEVKGLGLYAENVYLTGSLITQLQEGGYAGVNTLNGAKNDNNSPIIFWAGSTGTTADEIKKSPFRVAKDGSLYASKATIADSVVVGAELQASSIYTAKIFGSETKDGEIVKHPLEIYCTGDEQGVRFMDCKAHYTKETIAEAEETLRLTTKGFSNDGGISYFLELSKDSLILKDFDNIQTKTLKAGNIEFIETLINFNNNYYIKEQGSEFVLGKAENEVKISNNEIDLNTEKTKIKKDVVIGENVSMEYRQIEGKGYDIYITVKESEGVNG